MDGYDIGLMKSNKVILLVLLGVGGGLVGAERKTLDVISFLSL